MKTWILIETESGRCFDVVDTDGDEIPFPVHAGFEWCDVTELTVKPEHGWVAEVAGDAWVFPAPADNTPPFDPLGHLVQVRDAAARRYEYGGIVINLGEGQRADITALYARLQAGGIPPGFVLPWSENEYRDDPQLATIYITAADLEAFCLGALNQRIKAFAAYAAARQQLAGATTADQVEDLYQSIFASL